MKRVFAVLELADTSTFDSSSGEHLDELADDLLRVAHGVAAVAVYPSLQEMVEEESPS
jgi:hypothetical protein